MPATATCVWSKADTMHAARAGHRDVGQGPRRRSCRPARARPRGRQWDDRREWPLDELIDGVDPALAAAVLEIEQHIADARAGTSPPASTRWSTPPSWSQTRAGARPAMGLDEAAAAGSLTAVEQDQLGAGHRPGAFARVDRLAARASPAARPWSSGWCCRRTPTTQIPDDPAARGGVRPRAPRPPGGAHRRRRHPRRGDVLCPAAARPRRRPVGGRRAPTWCPACWPCCARPWTSPTTGRTRERPADERAVRRGVRGTASPPADRSRGARARCSSPRVVLVLGVLRA